MESNRALHFSDASQFEESAVPIDDANLLMRRLELNST
jgi:hypothetical protein